MRSDLTAAAAIRQAAMELLAARGFAGATVRDIAELAGVSAPLVIHHYGSKEGLRQAVDAHVVGLLEQTFAAALDPAAAGGDVSSMSAMLADLLESHPSLDSYLRRLLVDGDEKTTVLFRRLFESTREVLGQMESAGGVRPSGDPDARAAFLLANDLATIVLRDQIRSVLGVDPLSRDGLRRWTATLMDVYGQGVFAAPGEERQ